jgi:hypothetical protein
LNESREEREVEDLASPEKPGHGYSSSEYELSNTGFLGRAGRRCPERTRDDRELLDRIHRSQQETHEALHYNIETSREMVNGIRRMEGLLQQLVDIQMASLRSASRQSGRGMLVVQPVHEADDDDDDSEGSVLSYINDTEPAPIKEQPRAHFASQDPLPKEPPSVPVDDNEFMILVSLRKLRMKEQARVSYCGDFGLNQGWDETDLDYEIRMSHSAHAALMAEFHASATTNDLYRALAPQDGSTRVTNPPARCLFLSGSNTIPLPSRRSTRDIQEPSRNPIAEGDSMGGNTDSREESPGVNHTDRRGAYPGPRPSFSISTIMRRPSTLPTQPFTDWMLERTDKLVCNEVQNTMAAQFDWPGDVNISKLGLKLTPLDYSGGDTIDELLRFVKELTNYFLIYNLMKEDLGHLRVTVLGTLLKG